MNFEWYGRILSGQSLVTVPEYARFCEEQSKMSIRIAVFGPIFETRTFWLQSSSNALCDSNVKFIDRLQNQY